MNANIQKLMKISSIFRMLVLIGAAIVIAYLIYAYVAYGDMRFSGDALYMQLWQDSSVSRILLLAFKLPSFLMFIIGVYWLQRLLSYYQNGLFFGPQAMRCYLWLVWIKLFDLIIDIVETLAVGYYYRNLHGSAHIEVSIDFGNITTILLMLVIVYLLKAAKEIDAENKEFV
jgi:hypothetical protein